jgi:hypothetical protein
MRPVGDGVGEAHRWRQALGRAAAEVEPSQRPRRLLDGHAGLEGELRLVELSEHAEHRPADPRQGRRGDLEPERRRGGHRAEREARIAQTDRLALRRHLLLDPAAAASASAAVRGS